MSQIEIPIGVTRRIGPIASAAIGLSIALPVAIFTCSRLIIEASPGKDTEALILTAVYLLPLAALISAIGKARRGGGDLRAIAERLDIGPIEFSVGWLSIAGYGLIAAILIRFLGAVGQMLAAQFFETNIPLTQSVLAVTILALMRELLPRRDWWSARTSVIISVGLILVGVLVWQTFTSASSPTALNIEPTFD
ncbi:MAG: hypothetical protein MK135_17770, partial [Polyangiaceae bacterium]|nr:hypothetical protein [Polyangiaceae bacterium]